MGKIKLKDRVKYGICILFHKKEVRELRIPDSTFTVEMGLYKGCSKCDLWRKIETCYK